MSEELIKQIEELKVENEKLSKRNKLLQKRLNKMKKNLASSDDYEDKIEEISKNYIEYKVQPSKDGCPKCGAKMDTIDMNGGVLHLCSACTHREFLK